MRLAERCGAVTDHMNFGAKMRNVLTTQDRGWITTTFAEVKNRADVVLIVGSDLATRFPRFFERLITSNDAMFTDGAARQIVYVGDPAKAAACRAALGARKLDVIACSNEQLSEVLGVLRMLVVEHPALGSMRIERVGGVALAVLQRLAAQLKVAKYGVAAWAAADFDFAHAELTVQRIVELAKDLNKTTRFAGLPLGGSDGDLTMNQVHVWQSGFALRSDFGRGHADYDPHHNGAAQMLKRGEADALLWISSFNETQLPPPAGVPLVVLGRADMQFEREPEVFIPVGVPGVDHGGHFVRSDKVVTMRLGKLRESALPSVAEVVAAIERAVSELPSPADVGEGWG
jgi:formylmethanofuran dehydrogenase subunit B